MRVGQLFIDPVTRLLGQFCLVNLAGGDHHLLQLSADLVAVHVNVRKVVVVTIPLDLAKSWLQRAPVPKADVVERRAIGAELQSLE